jgi:hypothetical protein
MSQLMRLATGTRVGSYEILAPPDCARFAATALQATPTAPRRFVFVFNFFEELRQKAKPSK